MATLTGKTIADTYTSLLKLEGDTQTLVARASGNAIQVKTGDDEATPLYLNTDAIGIGTNTPAKSLVVAGSGQQEIHVDAATNAYLLLDAGGNSDTSKIIFQKAGSTVGSFQYLHNATATSESLRIVVNESGSVDPQMVIQADGKVGIGTTSPSHELTVSSSSENDPTIAIINESTSDQIGGNLFFINSHTDGTIASGQVLGDIVWQVTNNADADALQNAAAIKVVAGDTIGESTSDSPGEIQFHTTANASESMSQRMTIKSTGNVGIGVTGPSAALHVASDPGDNQEVALIQNSHSSIDAGDSILQLSFSAQDNCTDGVYINFHDSGGSHGNIDAASSTAVAYNTTSDYRLKENAKTISDALTRVCNLKPYSLNYKAAPGVTIDAFYAHEVQEVVPYVVRGEKDAVDSDGKIDPQMLDHSRLVPLLAAAIQELSAKVTALENA